MFPIRFVIPSTNATLMLYHSYASTMLPLYHTVIRTKRTKPVLIRPNPSIYCLKNVWSSHAWPCHFVRQLRCWPTLNVNSKLCSRIQWHFGGFATFPICFGTKHIKVVTPFAVLIAACYSWATSTVLKLSLLQSILSCIYTTTKYALRVYYSYTTLSLPDPTLWHHEQRQVHFSLSTVLQNAVMPSTPAPACILV